MAVADPAAPGAVAPVNPVVVDPPADADAGAAANAIQDGGAAGVNAAAAVKSKATRLLEARNHVMNDVTHEALQNLPEGTKKYMYVCLADLKETDGYGIVKKKLDGSGKFWVMSYLAKKANARPSPEAIRSAMAAKVKLVKDKARFQLLVAAKALLSLADWTADTTEDLTADFMTFIRAHITDAAARQTAQQRLDAEARDGGQDGPKNPQAEQERKEEDPKDPLTQPQVVDALKKERAKYSDYESSASQLINKLNERVNELEMSQPTADREIIPVYVTGKGVNSQNLASILDDSQHDKVAIKHRCNLHTFTKIVATIFDHALVMDRPYPNCSCLPIRLPIMRKVKAGSQAVCADLHEALHEARRFVASEYKTESQTLGRSSLEAQPYYPSTSMAAFLADAISVLVVGDCTLDEDVDFIRAIVYNVITWSNVPSLSHLEGLVGPASERTALIDKVNRTTVLGKRGGKLESYAKSAAPVPAATAPSPAGISMEDIRKMLNAHQNKYGGPKPKTMMCFNCGKQGHNHHDCKETKVQDNIDRRRKEYEEKKAKRSQ